MGPSSTCRANVAISGMIITRVSNPLWGPKAAVRHNRIKEAILIQVSRAAAERGRCAGLELTTRQLILVERTESR